MNLFVIIIIACVAYYLLKKQLLKNNTETYVKSIKYTLIVPIIQAICFLPLYSIGSDAIKEVGGIDRLRSFSTYAPLLGEELEMMGRIADKNGWIPEIERSKQLQALINIAGTLEHFVSIGLFIIIGLILTELYGVFRLGKFTQKQMRMFYFSISAILVIGSILIVMVATGFAALLQSGHSIAIIYIIPLIALVITGGLYMPYSKALDILFYAENVEGFEKENSDLHKEKIEVSDSKEQTEKMK